MLKLNKLIYCNNLKSSFNCFVNNKRVSICAEDFWNHSWNEGDSIAGMYLTVVFPVDNVQLCGSWQVIKGHVVEDDSFVVVNFKFSKGIDVCNP